MNLILNYLILILAIGIMGLYIYCFILNLFRTKKAKKELTNNREELVGKVSKIIVHKKKTYVKVQFVSPTNKMLFETLFEYFTDEFNNRYKEGDECKLIYLNPNNLKKVYTFPIFLEGDKIKMPLGATVTDILLVGFSIYVVASITVSMLAKSAFTKNVSITDVHSPIILVLYFIMHLLLITYAIERLNSAPQEENRHYLEICGYHTNAQVKTFKFAGSKNAKGFKEAQMEIEYYNGKGEKVKARCSSYYYSETQEEFVDILYDIKNNNNVVYVKSGKKKSKNK